MTAIYIRQRIVNVLAVFQANSPGLQAPHRRVYPDIMRQGGQLAASRYITPDLPIVSQGRHTGVTSGCAVTAGVTNQTVTVAAGTILFQDVSATVNQTTLTLAPADPTMDRTDAIVVNRDGVPSVIQGPYNDGSASFAPSTEGYIRLAYVYVFNQAHVSYTGTITQEMVDGELAAQQTTNVTEYTDFLAPAQTFAYTYSTISTARDPGFSTLNFDSATASAVTTMEINYTSITSSASVLPWLKQGTSISGARISPYLMRFRSRKNPSNWIMFEVLGGSITDHTTFGDVPVAFVAKSNSGSTIPLSTDLYDTILEFSGVVPVTYLFDIANLSGDVGMTNANQFYDGPSLASIGTSSSTIWLNAQITVVAGTTGDKITGKLWNGTTTIAQGEAVGSSTTGVTIQLSGIRQPTAPETWKISAASTGTGGTIKAAVTANSAGNFATRINYIRIN